MLKYPASILVLFSSLISFMLTPCTLHTDLFHLSVLWCPVATEWSDNW